MKRSPTRRTGRLKKAARKSPNAIRTAQRKAAVREFRWQLCCEVGRCEYCGRVRGAQNLLVHEIARGTSRQAALDQRCAVLVVCALICHEAVQNETKERQLARLWLSRPGDVNLPEFNRLRRRAAGAITAADIEPEIRWLMSLRVAG